MTSPAQEVRTFTVTIPASTAEASPYAASVSFPPRVVLAVRWQVPPGPSGLMGWRLVMSGDVPVIPLNGTWIVTDDAADTWMLADMPDSGNWSVQGYNTDIYDHSVYLDFMLGLTGTATPSTGVTPIPAAALAPPSAAAGITAGTVTLP